MKALLSEDQILGREEMKKIKGGGSCMDVCTDIAQACFAASNAAQGCCTTVCNNQLDACTRTCFGIL